MKVLKSEWKRRLQAPDGYRYRKSLSLVRKYEEEKFDVELYLQANGPGTFQRVLKVLPKHFSGRLPAVAVPFYFPEAMIGYDLETREVLPKYAGISMMADLAERGFITASADAYHLSYLKSDLGRDDRSRWHLVGAAFSRDYPEWSGMGKLTADTMLLTESLADDPRVAPGRIGIAGHSLGGKMAFYAGCLDSRVRAILASDFGIGWDQTNWSDSWYWGSKVQEMKNAGLDHSQLLSLSGGKPFCLLAGQYDNAESFELMQRAEGYEAHLERLVFLNHASGHRPPPEVLAAGYDFLERWLKKSDFIS